MSDIKPKPADTEDTTSKDEMIATLQSQIASQQEAIDVQQGMMAEFRAMVISLREQIESREEGGEVIAREADVDYEALEDDDNFLMFKTDIIPPDTQFPEGRKLSWKSPKLRANYGMRGWEPLKWTDPALRLDTKQGDEIVTVVGGALDKYIYAAPARMEGREHMTDHILRGDLMLCWIDVRDWNKRQRARANRASAIRRSLHDTSDSVNRQGVGMIGPGLTTRGRIKHSGLDPIKNGLTEPGRIV